MRRFPKSVSPAMVVEALRSHCNLVGTKRVLGEALSPREIATGDTFSRVLYLLRVLYYEGLGA